MKKIWIVQFSTSRVQRGIHKARRGKVRARSWALRHLINKCVWTLNAVKNTFSFEVWSEVHGRLKVFKFIFFKAKIFHKKNINGLIRIVCIEKCKRIFKWITFLGDDFFVCGSNHSMGSWGWNFYLRHVVAPKHFI